MTKHENDKMWVRHRVAQSRQSLVNIRKYLKKGKGKDDPKVTRQGHMTRTGSPLTYNSNPPGSKGTLRSVGGVRRFLLIPDVGRSSGMGTRRGATPWVGPQGWYERDEGRGLNSAEMNLELIEEHQAENLVFAQIQLLIHLTRGHTGLCYRTNSQSTVNPIQ